MSDYALYIHVPFCAKKCNYCDFTSYAGEDHNIPAYITAIKNELVAYADLLQSNRIKTVYFGGGTPSALSESPIEEIMSTISKHFSLSEKAEVSIEVNPGTVNLGKLQHYRKAGINRLSIGAQSFNDVQLKKLGRIHTSAQIFYTFKSARTAGFENINLDLIFALPGQDLTDWGNTLKKTLSLDPEHISTYNLVIEEGTPFHKEKDLLVLPSEEHEYMMFEDAIHTLTSSGYEHYEISNFAKAGRHCLNNLTYWKNEEYIGVGAGATSYVGSSRYSNPRELNDYIVAWREPAPQKIKDNYLAKKQERAQEFSETMFLGLRLTAGVDLKDLERKFGAGRVAELKNTINPLVSDGLLMVRDAHLMLTKKGLFLANEVFEKFV